MNRFTFSIVILAVSAVAWAFLLWPRYQILIESQKEMLQKKTELRYHKEYAQGLAELQKKVESKSAEMQIIQNSLPDTGELPALYEQMGILSAESGLVIKNLSIKPGKPTEASSQVQSISITIDTEGSYEGFKQFMEAVRKNPRILAIQSFRLTPSLQQGTFQSSIQMEAYSY